MEWLKKTKNAFSKCVLELNFASNSGLLLHFSKKVKIDVPYCAATPVLLYLPEAE
jgi:hypothetical protein